MDITTKSRVQKQLDQLVQSMMNRTNITMTGTRLDPGSAKGSKDTVIDVVNQIQVEDGSGCNYNITFKHNQVLYANLGNAVVVRPSSAVIVWHDLK